MRLTTAAPRTKDAHLAYFDILTLDTLGIAVTLRLMDVVLKNKEFGSVKNTFGLSARHKISRA